MSDRTYKNILWVGLALVVIYMPLTRGAVRTWSITPFLMIGAALIFLWLWRVNNKGRLSADLSDEVPSVDGTKAEAERRSHSAKAEGMNIDIPLLFFSLLAIVSFTFSINKHDSFLALLRLLTYIGVFYLIVNNFNREMCRDLLYIVIVMGTGLSVIGLLQYFGVLPRPWWIPSNFLASSYVNHNHFAGYLELVIPVTIGVLLDSRFRGNDKLRRGNDTHLSSPRKPAALPLGRRGSIIPVFLFFSVIIMLLAFIFTQSRGGWICLIMSLFVMTLVAIKHKILPKRAIFVFLILVVLVFAYAYFSEGLVSERISSILEIASDEPSKISRLSIWQGACSMILDNPVTGTGIGTFVWGLPMYRPIELNSSLAYYAHSDYFHVTAEMGLMALPLMLLVIVRIIRTGLKKGRSPITLGCSIAALSLSLHGFVDFNFHIPANMLLFVIYSAIIMRVNGYEAKPD